MSSSAERPTEVPSGDYRTAWRPRWAPADELVTRSPGADEAPLTAAQVAQWRNRGHIVLHGLWPADLVRRGRAACVDLLAAEPVLVPADRCSPSPEALLSAEQHRMREHYFPYRSDQHALNEITLWPRLHTAARQLLGTAAPVEVLLASSMCMSKTASDGTVGAEHFATGAQPHHLDHVNESLVEKLDSEGLPWSVSCILYYDHVDEVGGPTVVAGGTSDTDVSGRGSPWHQAASQSPELYRDELAVQFRPGTCLLYRIDTWHRGTPVFPGCTRYTHHISMRRSDATWMQSDSWLRDRWGDRYLTGLIGSMSAGQRSVLGFPPPYHPYWTEKSIAAAAERYEGFDNSEYRTALLERTRMSRAMAGRL